jgi:hypothetical protein
LHDLRGISRPVEQQRRGDERRALEEMATPTGAPAMTVAVSATKTAGTAPETAESGSAESGSTETGSTETGSTESGSTESAEKSTTRHLCRSFPLMSLPLI